MANSLDMLFLNPLAVINGKHYHFLRDWAGGEVPASIVYPPMDQVAAATLLNENGFKTAVIDASLLHIYPGDLVTSVKKHSPKYIQIPSAWDSYHSDMELAARLKDTVPSAKIVFSGPGATHDPGSFLKEKTGDFVILGEIEEPSLQIVKRDISSNIAMIQNGRIEKKPRKILNDLDLLPIPDRSLLHYKKYSAPFARRNPFTSMNISKGCQHSDCIFCPTSLWSPGNARYRSVDRIREEILQIVEVFGIGEILFRDQTFTGNRELVQEICDYLLADRLEIGWRCTTRVDCVDTDLLRLMKRAGCHQVSFGIESNSQEVLDRNRKGITLEESREAVLMAKNAGIEVTGLFMFGMLEQSIDSMRSMVRYARDLGVDYAQFNVATKVPSTLFFEEEFSSSGKDRPTEAVKASSPAGSEELASMVRKAYLQFYFHPEYLFRRIGKVSSFSLLFSQLKSASHLLFRGRF